MPGLRSLLARDGAVLTQSAHMGETVDYTPKGGSATTIPALVLRQPPDARPETSRARFRVASVIVRNSAVSTEGIEQPDRNGDTMSVVMEVGQAAVTARVTRVVYSDEMFHQLEVTA